MIRSDDVERFSWISDIILIWGACLSIEYRDNIGDPCLTATDMYFFSFVYCNNTKSARSMSRWMQSKGVLLFYYKLFDISEWCLE